MHGPETGIIPLRDEIASPPLLLLRRLLCGLLLGAGSAWAVILNVAHAFRTASSKERDDGSESQRKPISV